MSKKSSENRKKITWKGKQIMSQTDKGILIFYEWMEAMDKLPPRQYKALLSAICRFQQKGEEPPIFEGKSALLASVIFPFLRRRCDKARAGRMSAYSRYGLDDESIKIQEIRQRRLKEDT